LIAGKRKEKKITQTEMGDYLGLSLNSYRLIEHGGTQLKLNILLQISERLGLDFLKENIITDNFQNKELHDGEGENWKDEDENDMIFYKGKNGERVRYIEVDRSDLSKEKPGTSTECFTREDYEKQQNKLANNRFHNRKLKAIGYMKDYFESEDVIWKNKYTKKINIERTLTVFKSAISMFFPNKLTKKEIESLILLEKNKTLNT